MNARDIVFFKDGKTMRSCFLFGGTKEFLDDMLDAIDHALSITRGEERYRASKIAVGYREYWNQETRLHDKRQGTPEEISRAILTEAAPFPLSNCRIEEGGLRCVNPAHKGEPCQEKS